MAFKHKTRLPLSKKELEITQPQWSEMRRFQKYQKDNKLDFQDATLYILTQVSTLDGKPFVESDLNTLHLRDVQAMVSAFDEGEFTEELTGEKVPATEAMSGKNV